MRTQVVKYVAWNEEAVDDAMAEIAEMQEQGWEVRQIVSHEVSVNKFLLVVFEQMGILEFEAVRARIAQSMGVS